MPIAAPTMPLADRRVEAGWFPYFCCRPAVRGTRRRSSDILANDALSSRPWTRHGAADRLDHCHPRHGLDYRMLALAPRCGGIVS